ncbi:hypothetical protein IT072_03780 [Leifsonia sp. ZF2019]|uniref:hypothetical protein n=1 Tax=Leifsonia sp. ZF2019 TaxID=2781978 RepID=UPI001CBAB9F3|nr:hypothetical protein [Leifsonia sp. ZF2019]UAJ80178.1 hypothetical protein IT072_03780 [Leifsonia sp. ZF2019]
MSDGTGWIEIVGAAASVLSAGTAFVAAMSAASSKRSADDAQESALKAWQQTADAAAETNEVHKAMAEAAARRLRIPFARELKMYANSFLAKRVAGLSVQQAMEEDIADTSRVDLLIRLQSEADEPTASLITGWASNVYYKAPLAASDFPGMMALSQQIQDRLDLWVDDPKAAAALCEEAGAALSG